MKHERIIEAIENLDAESAIYVYNEWQDICNTGNRIETLEAFDTKMLELDADEIAEHCYAYDVDFGIEELREAIDEECKDE